MLFIYKGVDDEHLERNILLLFEKDYGLKCFWLTQFAYSDRVVYVLLLEGYHQALFVSITAIVNVEFEERRDESMEIIHGYKYYSKNISRANVHMHKPCMQ